MPIHLSKCQIDRIEKLLSDRSKETREEILASLVADLDRSFIFQDVVGETPSREIKVKREAEKVRETAELCYSLQHSLKGLDFYFFKSHDKEIIFYISNKIGISYEDLDPELSLIECLDGVIDGLISQFSSLEHDYANGYLDSLIMGVFFCWLEHYPTSVSLYENDNFVQLLTIILDTHSTEKVIKALRRSAIFTRHNNRLKETFGDTRDLFNEFQDQEHEVRRAVIDKNKKLFFKSMEKKYKL